jgi:hypothetical protein
MFRAKIAGSTEGALSAYTLEGPPERMIASGFFAVTSAAVIDEGTISE